MIDVNQEEEEEEEEKSYENEGKHFVCKKLERKHQSNQLAVGQTSRKKKRAALIKNAFKTKVLLSKDRSGYDDDDDGDYKSAIEFVSRLRECKDVRECGCGK